MSTELIYEFIMFFIETYGYLALGFVVVVEILVWAVIATTIVALRRKKIR